MKEICKLIEMPQEAVESILKAAQQINMGAIGEYIEKLTWPDCYAKAEQMLKEKLGEDEDGFKMLACMLEAAKRTGLLYRQKGIGADIYKETMKCFTRFVSEYRESYGRYGFDRSFWVGRQPSLQLFRLGELEYELVDVHGRYKRNAIDIHIPSDAVLVPQKCRDSVKQAEDFIKRWFPGHVGAPFVCCSWLLSPVLGQLLPAQSHINQFRNAFQITEWEKESMEFVQWVFKKGDFNPENRKVEDLPLADLPEHTSLQRRMKQHLLNGGYVGEASGELRYPPFGG